MPDIKGTPTNPKAFAKIAKMGYLPTNRDNDKSTYSKMRKIDISGIITDIERAIPYMSEDKDRPILNGVNISYTDGTIRVAAPMAESCICEHIFPTMETPHLISLLVVTMLRHCQP